MAVFYLVTFRGSKTSLGPRGWLALAYAALSLTRSVVGRV